VLGDVTSGLLDQFVVGAVLNDAAALDRDDPVGVQVQGSPLKSWRPPALLAYKSFATR
jgi:hypothetical protein